MNRFTLGLAALVVLVGVGIYFAATRPTVKPSIPPPPAETTARVAPTAAPVAVAAATGGKAPAPDSAVTAQPDAQPKSHRARLTIPAGQPIPELFPHQAERDQLFNLAASQDPKQIPVIAASLKHSDAGVREAARQALIQMGDASAVPYLRAAEAAAGKDEAELLKEAAEFLSLPRFMDVMTGKVPATSEASPSS